MKSIILLITTAFLSCALPFCACAGIDEVTPSPAQTAAVQEAAGIFTVTGKMQEFPEASPFGEPVIDEQTTLSEDAEDGRPFMRLYSYGEEVEMREFFMYGMSAHYDENGVPLGMLCADGMAFFDPDHIAGTYERLPMYTGCRAGELDIRLSEWAEIRQIYVYDPANGFERISVADKASLDRLIADTASGTTEYVVEIVVCMQGDYIEELGAYEYEANAYAFIVK